MNIGDKLSVKDRLGNYNGTPSIGDNIVVQNKIGFTSTTPNIGDKISVQVGSNGERIGYVGGTSVPWSEEKVVFPDVFGYGLWFCIIARKRAGDPSYTFFFQSRNINTLEKITEIKLKATASDLTGVVFYPDDGLCADSNYLYVIVQSGGGNVSVKCYSTDTGEFVKTVNTSGFSYYTSCVSVMNGYIIGNVDYYFSSLWNIIDSSTGTLIKQCSWGSRIIGAMYAGEDSVLVTDKSMDGYQYIGTISGCGLGSAFANCGSGQIYAIDNINNFLTSNLEGDLKTVTFKKYESGSLVWTKSLNVISST